MACLGFSCVYRLAPLQSSHKQVFPLKGDDLTVELVFPLSFCQMYAVNILIRPKTRWNVSIFILRIFKKIMLGILAMLNLAFCCLVIAISIWNYGHCVCSMLKTEHVARDKCFSIFGWVQNCCQKRQCLCPIFNHFPLSQMSILESTLTLRRNFSSESIRICRRRWERAVGQADFYLHRSGYRAVIQTMWI